MPWHPYPGRSSSGTRKRIAASGASPRHCERASALAQGPQVTADQTKESDIRSQYYVVVVGWSVNASYESPAVRHISILFICRCCHDQSQLDGSSACLYYNTKQCCSTPALFAPATAQGGVHHTKPVVVMSTGPRTHRLALTVLSLSS